METIKHLVLGVCFQLLLISSAYTQSFQDGADAYARGDYAGALSDWRPLADAGDASAQYSLGAMYFHGHGVAQSDGEAVRLF